MRNSRYSKPLAAALLTVFASTVLSPGASAASAPTLGDALRRIEAYAPQALAEQGAPGVSIAITDRTHTLRLITLGYANLDSKAPVTRDTRFPIGSITKGMTATALMELHDEGKFDPARPVNAYLPWFSIDSSGKTIYAHQVLSHTAGFPDDFTFAPGYLFSVAALRNARTIFTPGTRWSYSNDGFATAGAMLSALDGRAWPQALQARVFDRLGMTHSSTSFTTQSLADVANGYVFRDMNSILPSVPQLVSAYPDEFVDPAGSVISSPEDMARYMRFILNGGAADDGRHILTPASYTMLTTADDMNGKPAGPAGAELAEAPLLYQHYAFGFGVHAENGDKIVAHTGGIAGYSACMETNVTRGFGVIAMSNLVEAPLHPCAIVLYAMSVLQAQAAGEALPPVPAPVGMYLQRTALANAADYAGTYTSTDGSQLVLTATGNTLSLQTPGEAKTLYPRGGPSFYVDDPRFTTFGLTFARNKQNKVDEIFSGGRWYWNEAYAGPKTFAVPAAWNALLGRYESSQLWGTASASRVIAVKGQLTIDGTSPLTAKKDGTFALGSGSIRFDTPAAGKMQRMWMDGIPFYRIDLP